jgi:hypothetical protein
MIAFESLERHLFWAKIEEVSSTCVVLSGESAVVSIELDRNIFSGDIWKEKKFQEKCIRS